MLAWQLAYRLVNHKSRSCQVYQLVKSDRPFKQLELGCVCVRVCVCVTVYNFADCMDASRAFQEEQ